MNADAIVSLVQAREPRFLPSSRATQTLKSLILYGSIDERAVVVKKLMRHEPPWLWYARRELTWNRCYARDGRAPIPEVLATSEDDLWIMTAHAGSPLASGRLMKGPTDALSRILRARRSVASLLWPADEHRPDADTTKALRRSLLEDPSDPIGWCLDGLKKLAKSETLDRAAVKQALRAIESHPRIAHSHGDLLPRNITLSDEGVVSFIDWECAGMHHEAWDHALLWVAAHATQRAQIEDDFDLALSLPRTAAFWAMVLFAVGRELSYLRSETASRRGSLLDDQRDVAERLSAAVQRRSDG